MLFVSCLPFGQTPAGGVSNDARLRRTRHLRSFCTLLSPNYTSITGESDQLEICVRLRGAWSTGSLCGSYSFDRYSTSGVHTLSADVPRKLRSKMFGAVEKTIACNTGIIYVKQLNDRPSESLLNATPEVRGVDRCWFTQGGTVNRVVTSDTVPEMFQCTGSHVFTTTGLLEYTEICASTNTC